MANVVRAMSTKLTLKDTTDLVIGSLTSIGEITIEAEEIDTTTLDSEGAEYIQGNVSANEVAISGYVKTNSDEAQIETMLDLVASGDVKSWEVEFPSGAKWEFDAFVKSFGTQEASVDGLVGFSGSLRISGLPEYTKSVASL